jgi:hypothetical protein
MSLNSLDQIFSKPKGKYDSKKEFEKLKHQDILFDEISARIKRNQDTRIIVVGEAGIGKSTFGLKVGEKYQPALFIDKPDEAIENHVHLTSLDFMDAVVNVPTKSVLLYDEPAQSWHHRQFMSEANIILSKTMIGFRFKRFISVLCVPNIDLLDKDARKLCQFLVSCYRQGRAEIYKIANQKFGGPSWYPKLVDDFRFNTSNIKLWHFYMKKKERIQIELYQRFRDQLSNTDKADKTNDQIVREMNGNIDNVIQNGRLHVASIMGEYDIGRQRADAIRQKYYKKFGDPADTI